MKRTGLLLFCFLSLFLSIAQAQQSSDTVLNLRHGPVMLPHNAQKTLLDILPRVSEQPNQVLIRFREMPEESERTRLAKQGVHLTDFVDGTVFYATVTLSAVREQVNLSSIMSIVPVENSWKIDPLLDRSKPERIKVVVSWLETISTEQREQHVRACGGTIVNRDIWYLNAAEVELPANRLAQLADWYGVRYISPAAQDVPLNIESGNSAQVNIATMPTTIGGRGLSGAGVTVGVGDNFSGLPHVDLHDRVVNFVPWAYHNHGVHINGIVGGAGIVDPKGRGMAPGVRLLDHAFTQVWKQTSAMKQGYNMTLTNNSYSARAGNCNNAGVYDVYSSMLDNLSREEPEVLHVFAAGNDGRNQCGMYPTGYATVAGSYQAAKNVLVVANNTKAHENAVESSRGPVQDGRIKPEISAVGTEVYSTIRDDAYLSAGGTSMASPAVVGALALLTQRYKQLYGNTNPPGDLLKALIMNGAVDMGNPGPDYAYGFGVMNLHRSLEMLEQQHFSSDTISHGRRRMIAVTIPPNVSELKLMLYWHDTAATPAASKALVNDLDLEVITPQGTKLLPLVLNSAPRSVSLPARPGVDRVNNVEQVVIQNPEAGVYQIAVSGYQIPFGAQRFVVVWDVLPNDVKITFPNKGTAWPADDSLRIYWEAAQDGGSFKLEFSPDNGNAWSVIAENIPASQRHYVWKTPPLNTHQCRFRITRSGSAQSHISEAFVVHQMPELRLSSTQCPGYMAIEWDPIPNVGFYEVLQKRGIDMLVVDTVSSTSYIFSGLNLDSVYYAAVRPIIAGTPGWRSVAVRHRPNTGDCMGSISNGDLMVERILTPTSGRANTSTALGAVEPMTVMIRNLDDVAITEFELVYKVNNLPWHAKTFQQTLPPNAAVPCFVGNLSMSDTGTYEIEVVVNNLAARDPVSANDTARKFVRHYPNPPVDLDAGFSEGFESQGSESLVKEAMGLGTHERWDFHASTDTGRLRFFVSPEISIAGERSASFDAGISMSGNQNYLDGTFNMEGYSSTQHEVRLEFDYRIHGQSPFSQNNHVWVRGSDTSAWIRVYSYDTTAETGLVSNSGSISLTDFFRLAGQDFSSSTQVRFAYQDTSVIAALDYGNGLTVDDIRLYTARNDVELTRIVAPAPSGCRLGTQEPLTVLIRNRDLQAQEHINVFYRLDSGVVYSAELPRIPAKDSVAFTFPQLMDLSQLGGYVIDVWLAASGDNYPTNDSVMGFQIRHLPFIDSFPYLEQFETSDGNWYAEGKNSSWEHGKPASALIAKAASGQYAWKTNLEGYYNDLEYSFLYSPCFDLSGLSDPMLSFSIALDIEQCEDEFCDAAWIEYSTDGEEWKRLGTSGAGTNWYNTDDQVWSVAGFTRWHVASVSLPRAAYLRLRFVMKTDPAVAMEGIAIDDIHIFDRARSVYTGMEQNASAVHLNAGEWKDVTKNDQWIAQLNNRSKEDGQLLVAQYPHNEFYDARSGQYFFPKSFTIIGDPKFADTVSVRLFISDYDFVRLLTDTDCLHCSKANDVYALGITQYLDADTTRVNGSLSDNLSSVWIYHPAEKIQWIPYDNGYHATVNINRSSELWLNDGGPMKAFPLTFPAVELHADKIDDRTAELLWTSHIDSAVERYEVERSFDSVAFTKIAERDAAQHPRDKTYRYADRPNVEHWVPVFYRVRYFLTDGTSFQTETKRIQWSVPDFLVEIFPNPSRNGHCSLIWSSMPGGILRVKISDFAGRKIYEDEFPATSWNNVSMIRLNNLAKGVYLIDATIGEHRFGRKLIIY